MPKTIFEAAKTNDVRRLCELLQGGEAVDSRFDRKWDDCTSHILLNLAYYGSVGILGFSTGVTGFLAAISTLSPMPPLVIPLGGATAGLGVATGATEKALYDYTFDEEGWTPLMFAALGGAPEAAAMLVRYGANLRFRDRRGRDYEYVLYKTGNNKGFNRRYLEASERYAREDRESLAALRASIEALHAESATFRARLGGVSQSGFDVEMFQNRMAALQTQHDEIMAENQRLQAELKRLQVLRTLEADERFVGLQSQLLASREEVVRLKRERMKWVSRGESESMGVGESVAADAQSAGNDDVMEMGAHTVGL